MSIPDLFKVEKVSHQHLFHQIVISELRVLHARQTSFSQSTLLPLDIHKYLLRFGVLGRFGGLKDLCRRWPWMSRGCRSNGKKFIHGWEHQRDHMGWSSHEEALGIWNVIFDDDAWEVQSPKQKRSPYLASASMLPFSVSVSQDPYREANLTDVFGKKSSPKKSLNLSASTCIKKADPRIATSNLILFWNNRRP